MGAKLEANKYKDRFAFQEDFKLMISNAKTYNMPGSHVHNEAINFETFFEKRRFFVAISPEHPLTVGLQNGRIS